MGAVLFENLPGMVFPLGVIGVDREKDSPGFHALVVTVGGMFRKPQADQCADQTAAGGPDAGAHQSSEEGTRGNERSESGDT